MAKKQTAVSNEQIIAALMQRGTIRDTAAAVGLSERALYDRMNDGEFAELYQAAKSELLRTAVISLNGQIQAAIDTTVEIMQDKNNNAAVRLQAAQTVLNTAGRFADRLQKSEDNGAAQREANMWGI